MFEEIKGYPQYRINARGLVVNIRTGKIKKPFLGKRGYYRIRLFVNGKGENKSLHRLVAQAFIPNPETKPFINHLNNDPSDNRVENLEWCTQSENVIYAYKQGRAVGPRGEKNGSSKLKAWMIPIIKGLRAKYKSQEIADYFCVHRVTIDKILRNEAWK